MLFKKSVALVIGVTAGLLSATGCNSTERGIGWQRPGMAYQAHAVAPDEAAPFTPPPAASQHISFVSRQRFGGRGNFGDVWVHGNYAYVGSFRAQNCPGHGVSIADVSDPARPTAISTFAAYPRTAAEDMEVTFMASRHFVGTLAAVGLQDCSETPGVKGMHSLELWDTTNPRRPVRLGFYDIRGTELGGVHELKLFQRNGRYYVILAANYYGVADSALGESDVRILDVTNPRAPVQVSSWGAGRDGRLAYGSPLFSNVPPANCEAPPGGTSDCRAASSGGYPVVAAHSVSVSPDGTRAYVAYWDAGMITLDIRDITRPRMIGRANSGPQEEGDLHSAIEVPYFNGNVAITTDEDFSPLYNTQDEPNDVWGFARIWNISNPARPRQIATIASPHGASNRTDGIYSVHNPVTVQNLAFFSWYTDGVRVYDIANPSRPDLVAFFDAPRVVDPAPGEVPIPTGSFWGIYVRLPYIYASDMNAGLYVLRLSPKALSKLRTRDDDHDDDRDRDHDDRDDRDDDD